MSTQDETGMFDSVYHIPVLVDESIDLLLYNKEKTGSKLYIDCTLGGGGYTEKILNQTDDYTKVIAIDRDVNAVNFCKKYMKKYSERIIYCLDNFSNVKNILNNFFKTNKESKISGVVLDLGLSSYQLNHEEGFSYQKDTDLDMRSDKNQKLKASDILNTYGEKELIKIFKNYGELKYYKQICRDIIQYRESKKFSTTFDLVNSLKKKIPAKYHNKDLSKIFQTLRIEVNNELDNLKKVLADVLEFLESGARIVVVSYHSLEDRIVKNFFRSNEYLNVITKKPMVPSLSEIETNVRSRSAKLRAAQRI